MRDVRYAWTLDSINDIELDSDDEAKFTKSEAKKIIALCAKLRAIVTGASERHEAVHSGKGPS